MGETLHECVECEWRTYQNSTGNPVACQFCGGRMHRLGDTLTGSRE